VICGKRRSERRRGSRGYPPRVRLGIPAYFHPAIAAADWRALTQTAANAPVVVLNVATGPGRAPEPDLAAAALRARRAGARVLGYVDTAYGWRRAGPILREVHRYRSWYGLDGVFFDRASASRSHLPIYGAITGAARRAGIVVVALGHGVYPAPEYTVLADLLVAFEGPWSAYAKLSAPEWAARMAPSLFWHLVYEAPPHALGQAMGHARRCNAGVLYVTDKGGANPWDGLPSYFQRLAAPPGAMPESG
jgi:Spherulation-specific family 4